jgi:hypothetical protein
MIWFESTNTLDKWSDPIPLVAFPPGSLYREAMFECIEHENAAGTSPISAAAFTTCWSGWKPDSPTPSAENRRDRISRSVICGVGT